jgi:hypothetical protein
MLKAEKRVQRFHSLPIFAIASVNITPVSARVSFSIFSLTAGPVFRSISVSFISPPSLLPINAVSTSSLSSSPIGSLPSLICSDLAAKYTEFEYDHSLPASLIPSSIPNASDTDFLIKLAIFRDALVCLSPAAFDAVIKVLAMPELSGPAQEALDFYLSPNKEY